MPASSPARGALPRAIVLVAVLLVPILMMLGCESPLDPMPRLAPPLERGAAAATVSPSLWREAGATLAASRVVRAAELSLAREAPSSRPTHLVEPRDPLPEGAVVRIGTVRLRHGDDAEDVVYSPDGTRVASVCRDLRIWDARSGRILQTLEIGPLGGRELLWHPDGERLVVSGDGGLSVVDLARGEVVRELATDERGTFDLQLDPSGRQVLAGTGNGHVGAWDLETGERTLWLEGHTAPVWDVALSADGALLASAGADERVRVVERDGGEVVAEFLAPRASRRIGFLDEAATTLYSAGLDGVFLWRLDGSLLAWFDGTEHTRDLVPLPQERLLVAAGSSLSVWDARTQTKLSSFEGHRAAINGLGLSPDGALVASASDDNTVRVWDVARGAPAVALPGEFTELRAVRFVPGRSEVVLAGLDGLPVRVDLDGRVLAEYASDDAGIDLLAISSDGRVMAATDGDHIELWRVDDGTLLRRISLGLPLLDAIVLSPDGRELIGAWDGVVYRWPTRVDPTNEARRDRSLVVRAPYAVEALAMSEDGQRLVVAGSGQVGLVDPWDGTWESRFDTWPDAHATDVALSRDGARLAIATGRRLLVVDLDVPGARAQISELADGAQRVVFTPDGAWLAVGGREGTIVVLSTRTLEEQQRFDAHAGTVEDLAVSSDGRYLASVAGGASALIWSLGPAHP